MIKYTVYYIFVLIIEDPVVVFESINETIEVISYFSVERMRPLRFRWRDRAYHIRHIQAVWNHPAGANCYVHYHVTTKESGTFELVYDSGKMQWILGRVCLDE